MINFDNSRIAEMAEAAIARQKLTGERKIPAELRALTVSLFQFSLVNAIGPEFEGPKFAEVRATFDLMIKMNCHDIPPQVHDQMFNVFMADLDTFLAGRRQARGAE